MPTVFLCFLNSFTPQEKNVVKVAHQSARLEPLLRFLNCGRYSAVGVLPLAMSPQGSFFPKGETLTVTLTTSKKEAFPRAASRISIQALFPTKKGVAFPYLDNIETSVKN